MHDGMPYDPIQGQGQGHGASDFRFQIYQNRSPKAKNHKIYSKQKNNTTDNRTMRYTNKHTVDFDVAQNSEWQQGRLC